MRFPDDRIATGLVLLEIVTTQNRIFFQYPSPGGSTRTPGGMCTLTTDELITYCVAENKRFVQEVQIAVSPLSSEQLNQAMPNGDWSIARVLQHMILANSMYLEILPPLIASAESGSSDLRHTWFGKALIKIAGPKGNVAAPSQMVPDDKQYGESILDEWVAQQNTAIELMISAKGKNLNQLRFKNPFLRLFTMNVSDTFAIMTTHTDRHFRQILERVIVASLLPG